MHHTDIIIGRRWGGRTFLLLMVFALGSRVGVAQETAPRSVIVPVNGTKSVPLAGKALVSRIQVENPAVVRANPTSDARGVLFTGLAPGRTLVSVFDTEGGKQVFEVLVQLDVEYLRLMLRRVMPTAVVEPIPSGNTVILSGTVAKAEDVPVILAAAQSIAGGTGVVNALHVGGVQQVQLDVVVAQVARNQLRQMGFSFIQQGQQHFVASVLTGNNSLSSVLTPAPGAVTSSLQSTPNLALGFVNNREGFLGFLQALRTEGLAKLLAEPRLVTLSGKPANFLSGGQLAVPEPSGLGTNAVAFYDFGTELSFLPIVLGNGKIHLEVEPLIKNINASNGTTIQGTTVPGFDVQRLHTTVEMEPGQTFALGGLVQHTVSATAQKVPLAGDIPFLNTFFSLKSYNEAESELLILVTPHLVDPMACDQLPRVLPGQETRRPDDFELFLEGILEAPRGQRAVFVDHHYQAAYRNGPSAAQFPCAGGVCGVSDNGVPPATVPSPMAAGAAASTPAGTAGPAAASPAPAPAPATGNP
jgi:pilus assembly protein CpaC